MDRELTTPEALLPRIEAKDTTITNQEVFEAVCVHLSRQKKRALANLPNRGETCAYRGDNGLKCAVGALIPDVVYSEIMEGKCVADIIYSGSGLEALSAHEILLTKLQNVHDEVYEEEGDVVVRIALAEVAGDYGLKHSFVNELTFTEA